VTCEAAECIPNIEQVEGCSAQVNCCDPAAGDNFSTINCLDSNTPLSAVLALAQAGIKTIVVGIPGSAEYATLLNLMAVAGGVPREGDTRYYRVDDLSDLESLLLKIGSEITVSCDITLNAPPTDPNEVNVFFDQTLLPYDPENGWEWTGPTTITLRGQACDDLTSGAAGIVRVVEGCPTEGLKLPPSVQPVGLNGRRPGWRRWPSGRWRSVRLPPRRRPRRPGGTPGRRSASTPRPG
jgi:hypothetical protein